ncbi:dirigent protein 22-like [Pistacia vera]|uniref:dirigent protein 22-like n=1 Tax=Pistacia vera TaxID=55513 RepID=UPI001263BC44|nr:dirigent protein 22-like [Pistacia vera]
MAMEVVVDGWLGVGAVDKALFILYDESTTKIPCPSGIILRSRQDLLDENDVRAIESRFVSGENYGYAKTLDQKLFGLKNGKLSHFCMHWHDIDSGSNPTAVRVVSLPSNSLTIFGTISMIDDPLTEGLELSSKLVGKTQGMYAWATQEEFGLSMVMNFAFVEGKYNGSTITIIGRNKVFPNVREVPMVRSSGLLRFARGYVQASTHKHDLATGDAELEYNIYMLHY